MANLNIAEYRDVGTLNGAVMPIPKAPAITVQNISYTGTAGLSAAVNLRTRFVKLQADGKCGILFSTAGTTATSSNTVYLIANVDYWFAVERGLKVSVITVS